MREQRLIEIDATHSSKYFWFKLQTDSLYGSHVLRISIQVCFVHCGQLVDIPGIMASILIGPHLKKEFKFTSKLYCSLFLK